MTDQLSETSASKSEDEKCSNTSRSESIPTCNINQKEVNASSNSALVLIVPDEAYTQAENRECINIFNFYHHIPQFKPLSEKLKTDEFRVIFKRTACIVLLILYFTYFTAVLITPSEKEVSNYWCDGDGFLIINTAFYSSLLLYFQVVKPYFKKYLSEKLEPFYLKAKRFNKLRKVKRVKSALIVTIYIIFILSDSSDDFSRMVSAFGIFVLLGTGALFSKFPFKIRFNSIISGIGIQMVFGLLILRWSVGKKLFECLGAKVTAFLSFTEAGTTFAIGDFLNTTNSYAFKILPVILYFGMIISILYHYGIIQWIIIKLGWLLEISMGTTPCESMATAANIFLGQSEAPLVIRPYVPMLTKSEIHAVLTGGFATVAGGILAAYISFGIDPAHLLSASIMSAPAALSVSKLFYPETEHSTINKENIKLLAEKRSNVIHAIMTDLMANLPLIANITGVLIIVLAATSFVNTVLDWFCQLLAYEEGTCTVQGFLGILFSPLAWLMGVPWEDCYVVGRLLGIKVFITEFLAYKELMDKFKEGLVSSRSVVITTYALCGFSSIASMGCQIGALSCLAPSRINDIASLLFRSFIAGNFACFLTACVAGTLIHEPATRISVFNGTSLN